MLSVKAIITVLAVAVIIVFIIACSRKFIANTDGGLVTLGDFPELLSALTSSGGNGSFWVALVPSTARDDGNFANLQYSIEGGTVGMDWVLLAKRNIEDKEAFTQFVTAAGATVTERVMNNVRYLRVSDHPDLAKLGQDFLQSLYHVSPDDKLRLIITDFSWTPKIRPLTFNQAMQRTASKAATDVVRVCDPRFPLRRSCIGLVVADLVSR